MPRRKVKKPIEFWALPVIVQDTILEQAALGFTLPRALGLRSVCKHFDKMIRRTIFGRRLECEDLLGGYSDKENKIFPLAMCFLERTRIRNEKNTPLIRYLITAINGTIKELRVEDDEKKCQRVANIVCRTAAVALYGEQRDVVRTLSESWSGIPFPLATALGLRDHIERATRPLVRERHTIFGLPVEIASYSGNLSVIRALLPKMRLGTGARTSEKTLLLAAHGGHTQVYRELFPTVPDMPRSGMSPNVHVKALYAAVRARQSEVFKYLYTQLWLGGTRPERELQFCLMQAIKLECYPILHFLIRQMGGHDTRDHTGSWVYCRKCQMIGDALATAAAHRNNDVPLQLLLMQGWHPDTKLHQYPKSSTLEVAVPSNVARRLRTHKLLYAYGADPRLALDEKLMRATRRGWMELILFIGAVLPNKTQSDQLAFDRALRNAVRNRRVPQAKALIAAGAAPSWGLTAWEHRFLEGNCRGVKVGSVAHLTREDAMADSIAELNVSRPRDNDTWLSRPDGDNARR